MSQSDIHVSTEPLEVPTHSTATRIVSFHLEVVNADLVRNDLKPAEMWTGLEDALAADELGLVYSFCWEVREAE